MSGGDDADTIIRAFICAEKWECDVLIIATHQEKSKTHLTISWTALEAMIVAYGLKWIRINKNEATDVDRTRTSEELRRILNRCVSSQTKEH